MTNENETGKSCTFRLSADAIADILAMADHVGKPGNLTAGFYGLVAEWRRLKAELTARPMLKAALEAVLDDIGTAEDPIFNSLSPCTRGMVRNAMAAQLTQHEDRAAQIARQRERLDAQDRHEEATMK